DKLADVAESARQDVQQQFAQQTMDLNHMGTWVESALAEGRTLEEFQADFLEAAALVMDRYPAPASALLAEVPEGSLDNLARKEAPLLQVLKNNGDSPWGDWRAEYEPASTFWQGPFAQLALQTLRNRR